MTAENDGKYFSDLGTGGRLSKHKNDRRNFEKIDLTPETF